MSKIGFEWGSAKPEVFRNLGSQVPGSRLKQRKCRSKKKKKRRPFGYLQLKAHLGVREWLLLAS